MQIQIPNADTTTLKGVVIPDAFKQPDWVETTYDNFVKKFKEDYSSNKMINVSLVRTLIRKIILDDKVSPSWPLNKKNVQKMLDKMFVAFGDEEFQWRYMLVYRIGFFLSTFAAPSFTPEALILPDQYKKKRKIIIDEFNKRMLSTDETDKEKAIHWVDKQFGALTEEVMKYFKDNREKYPIIDSFESGAKGGKEDLRKLLVAVGLSINAKNEINDVIARSHAEALTPTQFFNYSSQAIVSQYKKSSETAAPGYLIRQLNTLMVGVRLSKLKDCGSKGTLSTKILSKEMLKSMQGKIYRNGSSLEEVPFDIGLVGQTIKLRSALYCVAKDGVCATCYNPGFIEKMHLEDNAGIGLLASSSQAALLTNLTLKAAHTGLSLDKEEVDLEKDIFEFSE